MLILLLLEDKIKSSRLFLTHSQGRCLMPGLRLVTEWQWRSTWNQQSPPSDNTFSGSCKDIHHINGDMHHRDVKSASAHGGRSLLPQPAWDRSAEMGAQTLPSPTIQSFSTTPGQSLWRRVGGQQGGGQGASSGGGRQGWCSVDRVRTRECLRARKQCKSC